MHQEFIVMERVSMDLQQICYHMKLRYYQVYKWIVLFSEKKKNRNVVNLCEKGKKIFMIMIVWREAQDPTKHLNSSCRKGT